MHKNFAKTLFLGKRVFFLTECHSTSDLMLDRIRAGESMEGDVIHADFQSGGKGQRGSKWVSEPEKNLLFSINVTPSFIAPDQSFLLNVAVSLALQKTISSFTDNTVLIKWPNDIYVKDQKISGLLIQCLVEGSRIKNAIIGIGLNINQRSFGEIEATSISLLSGEKVDREYVLEVLLQHIESYYLILRSGKADDLILRYHEHLYRRGELHQFQTPERIFYGEIIGIDKVGRLNIRDGETLRSFNVKEVEFLG